MTRQLIVAGNWKMNKEFQEGVELASSIAAARPGAENHLVIMATPFIHLHAVSEIVKDAPYVKLAAQNCHQEASGAFTGEVSVGMLQSVGVEYIIIGHSERREYFNESHELLASKTIRTLAAGMTPIFCCGEALAIREAGTHVDFVAQQLKESLFDLSAEDFQKIVIAYEPIWAIGTGVTASPQQAQDMHREIRQLIAQQYGAEIADATTILYGGSVKPANAKELFGQPDVDGGLVGGASLNAEGFLEIVKAL